MKRLRPDAARTAVTGIEREAIARRHGRTVHLGVARGRDDGDIFDRAIGSDENLDRDAALDIFLDEIGRIVGTRLRAKARLDALLGRGGDDGGRRGLPIEAIPVTLAFWACASCRALCMIRRKDPP